MATYNLNEAIPFRAVHPGEIIKDELKERGISQKELAATMEMPASVVNELINGKRNLNAEYALSFSKVLEIPAESLLELQNLYDLDKIRINERNIQQKEAENEFSNYDIYFDVRLVFKQLGMTFSRSSESLKWLKSTLNLPPANQMQMELEGLFRRSSKQGIDRRRIMTWKLLAEYSARQVSLSSEFDESKAVAMIADLRAIFNENKNTLERLETTLNSYGIIFCIVEKLDKASVDGYCFMCGQHPAIIISKRYNRIDNLAFTVMHELGHILNHFSSDCSSFIHFSDKDSSDIVEIEADNFAQEALIPKEIWEKAPKTRMSIPEIQAAYSLWARQQGLNKWIVLGRVSHETGIWKFRSDRQRAVN